MTVQLAPSRQLAARWSTAASVLTSASSITIVVCNGLMSTELGKLNGRNLFFQMNHTSISETMMAAFVLDAMPLNAAFQSILGAIFQQDNARPHVAKTVRDFCSAQHMQLLPWLAYSPDMSPMEYVWDFPGRHLARSGRNSVPQADIENLFDSKPLRISALNVAYGGYTKY
ncbi:transposable element Tcb2 transposase [Trichonephila clavipes]|nr:transposable element Tcb2 transposase [Trichonephila clavipes]